MSAYPEFAFHSYRTPLWVRMRKPHPLGTLIPLNVYKG